MLKNTRDLTKEKTKAKNKINNNLFGRKWPGALVKGNL